MRDFFHEKVLKSVIFKGKKSIFHHFKAPTYLNSFCVIKTPLPGFS